MSAYSSFRFEGKEYFSNTLTNLCIALYCILLYCVVLSIVIIYCYVDIIQYNVIQKFVGVLDNFQKNESSLDFELFRDT